jgi:glycosyltransferase involved in cell wall biosynthesis
MTDPGISVVLPCYNHARFLPERIDSILCQTLPVAEIIFIDDASTDGSFELAKSLLDRADLNVSFFRNHFNSGSPFIQWNKGVRLAKYPLIWIAESDDSCRPNLLQRLFTAMTSSQAVLTFAQSAFVSADGSHMGSCINYTRNAYPLAFERDFIMEGNEFNIAFMSIVSAIPNASAVLIDKEAYLEVGMANETMRYAGDWDLWVRVASLGNVAFVAEQLNFFRHHSNTTRAHGINPQISAEHLNCKIKALRCKYPNEHLVVNLFWAFRYLAGSSFPPLRIRKSSIWPLEYLRVCRCYGQLSCAPTISIDGWLAIGLISLCVYLNKLARRFT